MKVELISFVTSVISLYNFGNVADINRKYSAASEPVNQLQATS